MRGFAGFAILCALLSMESKITTARPTSDGRAPTSAPAPSSPPVASPLVRRPAGLIGLGHYVPERVLTNADLEKLVETSNEWIVERTGIRERRIVAPDQSLADIAENAARAALRDANLAIDQIDLIIVATCTPEYLFPSTAATLQHRLGATCGAFDLGAACSGFVYGVGDGEPIRRERRDAQRFGRRRRSDVALCELGKTATPASCSATARAPPSSRQWMRVMELSVKIWARTARAGRFCAAASPTKARTAARYTKMGARFTNSRFTSWARAPRAR